MLDLDAAVQLEEEELVAGEEELGRARAPVADGVGERDGGALDAAGSSGESPGGGVSSTTFWWRRWIEQSRRPSANAPPASAMSCTSTWRGRSR